MSLRGSNAQFYYCTYIYITGVTVGAACAAPADWVPQATYHFFMATFFLVCGTSRREKDTAVHVRACRWTHSGTYSVAIGRPIIFQTKDVMSVKPQPRSGTRRNVPVFTYVHVSNHEKAPISIGHRRKVCSGAHTLGDRGLPPWLTALH